MTFRLRSAHPSDVESLYEMAKLTGGGFTNLPPDKQTLEDKLGRAAEGFARQGETQADDLYLFMLEDFESGAIQSSDEYLIVASLAERAQLSALALLRLAEGGIL